MKFKRHIPLSIPAVVCALMLLTLAPGQPDAQTAAPPSPPPVHVWHQISGHRFDYTVGDDDTGRSIAARFGEPETTLPAFKDGEPDPGSVISLDNRHVAPAVIDDGIVINVPQRMLFLFHGGRLAGAWPVTVGRPDWPTPLGSFYIASRRLNPSWHVPPAIKEEMEEEGIDVPDVVKPGPKNPLGKSFLGLDHGGIGIHGTNRPLSIFLFGSHGCIRLSTDNAMKLFHTVRSSEPVEIIYEPVSLAVLNNGSIFLESDSDPYGMGRPHIDAVRAAARRAGVENAIDWERASRVLVMVEGVARRIDGGAAAAAPGTTLPSGGVDDDDGRAR